MGTLKLSAGERSEELLAFVTRQVDDTTLDSMTVEREQTRTAGVASEPITTAVLLTVTPIVAATISRLVERWLESRRQQTQLQIVLDGFAKSDEAGRQLAQLATKYADVSVSFGPLPPIGSKQPGGSSAAEADSK
jgi:hypothetical protein